MSVELSSHIHPLPHTRPTEMMPTRRLPRRRPDLVVRPVGDRDRFVVKDPRTGAYFQIGRQEQFLLTQLDGVQSAAAVRRAFEREFGEQLTDDDLGQFLELAESQTLLTRAEVGGEITAPPPVAPRPLHHVSAALLGFAPLPLPSQPIDHTVQTRRPDRLAYPSDKVDRSPAASPANPPPIPEADPESEQSLLYWRKSLFDPDRLFDRLIPYLTFLWTRGFLVLSLAVMVVAAVVLLANWSDLMSGFVGAIRWETVALVWVTLLVATTLHEFAHGLTLKRFGGEVKQIGVLVMFFLPCLFCNVSDAWLLRERWKRLLVTLAGGYCDLCLWAVSVFVWRLTPPDGLPNYLAFVAMTVLGARVFFNFNPFLKLDGYYLLSDWLEIPNLLQQGRDRVKAHVRRWLWGAPPPPADPSGRAITAYGLASWGYQMAFLGVTVYALVRVMWGWLGTAGVAIAVGLGVVTIRSQVKGLAGGEVRKMLTGRRTRVGVWLLILAAVAGLAMLPIPDRASGPFRVRAGAKIEFRAPTAGILREVAFDEGDEVPAGAVVARLEVPDLASRLARKRAEAAEARAKLDLLKVGPNPAQVTELTERVERAERWHALAQSDLKRDQTAHREDLVRLDALVAKCEAEKLQATNALDRAAALRGQGAAATAEHEAATARAAVCREQLEQALAERRAVRTRGAATAETELARRAKEWADATGALTLLKAGPRPEEVAAAQASLARADEEVRYLVELGDKLTLRAVRGGRVTTPRLRERIGRLFPEGELIAEVEDTAVLEVEVSLREGQTARVTPGQEVDLLPRAFPFQTLRGHVKAVAPAARRPGERLDGQPSPTTPNPPAATQPDAEGQVAVYCVLESGGPELRPGMTGHARVHRGKREAGIVLVESLLRTVRIEFWR